MMTNRERLLAVLKGEPVDRVPIWLLFPYHPVDYYVDVRRHPGYRRVFEASKKYAVMLNRRNLRVPVFTEDVVYEEITTESDPKTRWKRWRYRSLELTSSEILEAGGGKGKQLLSSGDDLEVLAQFPINTDRESIQAILDRQLPRYLDEKREFPEEYGAMMLDLGEPIGFLYHNSDLEEYAVWSLTHNDLVKKVLDRLMEQKRIIYQYCLERDLADVYFMVGSELASPPLVSPQTFREWIVSYAKELVDLVHSYGKYVIMHYHGFIKTILPYFLEMGPDALHTIEAPPVGDCTLTEAYSIVGDRIALIGNIQYDCFRSYTLEEMDRAVQEVIEEAKGKRFILSPTAGPYDGNVDDRVIANYLQFLKSGWEYGTL
ncbi:MAG: hypothetical protein GX855_02030 [Firmicutes bacterium]|nr:hypothetical protein [Bacillota bacterium]